MDDNTNESPVDERGEETAGSSNDNDDFKNVFQDQSPDSGTDINLVTMGTDQQIRSQSVDMLASNQHQRASLSPTSISASEAMDPAQNEEIFSRHLGTPDDLSNPRQFSENSHILERTDIGSPRIDQYTSETKDMTLESDYSLEEENYEITEPITSKKKKECLESYFRESGTENELLMSMSQPSKAASTPYFSRINIRTLENKETECFERPSLSSIKKRQIDGSIDDQPPLVTNDKVRSVIKMDLKAMEFRKQYGGSDKSSMEKKKTSPNEPASIENNQEVPPQSNQAISSESVPFTKPSEWDIILSPSYEGEQSASCDPPKPANLGYNVSRYICDARGLLFSILKDIFTFREEERRVKILEKRFELFLNSPSYATEMKLHRRIFLYLYKTQIVYGEKELKYHKSLDFIVTEYEAVLIGIVSTALFSTLSKWASLNFDAIILNIGTYTALYEKFLVLFDKKKIEDVQNEVSRNKIIKFKTFMEEILLRMNIAINFLLMYLGVYGSQKDREKCEKRIRNEQIKYLRLELT